MDTQLPITSLAIPASLCYSTPQADYPILATYLKAIFSGSEVVFGSSTPAAADRTKPWFRTNTDGTDDGMWVFYNGFWIQKHPLFIGAVLMWEGAQANIPTLDGGEAAPVTNITGPFFEEVTEMAARSPLHPGTLPLSTTVVGVGDNVGEDRHTMLAAELVAHQHDIKTQKSGGSPGNYTLLAVKDSAGEVVLNTELSTPATPTAFNVVHPVRGIFFLRRTARVYRRRVA